MKRDDSELIWEQYSSPDRGEMDKHDEHGREYLYRGPKDGAFESEQQMRRSLEGLPMEMSELFKPSREGSYYVLVPSDEFKSYGSDGDGMGGTIEHDLGYAIVGLADGHFLEYIKYPAPEEIDPDEELHRQTMNDYMRGEGLPERDDR